MTFAGQDGARLGCGGSFTLSKAVYVVVCLGAGAGRRGVSCVVESDRQTGGAAARRLSGCMAWSACAG